MPDKFDITEVSDFALFRIGGENEGLVAKAQADLADAREVVDKIKDRLAALMQTEREINAEINRRGLTRFAGSDDA